MSRSSSSDRFSALLLLTVDAIEIEYRVTASQASQSSNNSLLKLRRELMSKGHEALASLAELEEENR